MIRAKVASVAFLTVTLFYKTVDADPVDRADEINSNRDTLAVMGRATRLSTEQVYQPLPVPTPQLNANPNPIRVRFGFRVRVIPQPNANPDPRSVWGLKR